jgi:hypothetical protein
MEYLSDVQMKKEKPLKSAYTRKNNALEKFLKQSGQLSSVNKVIPGRRFNIYFSPRMNRVIVLN